MWLIVYKLFIINIIIIIIIIWFQLWAVNYEMEFPLI